MEDTLDVLGGVSLWGAPALSMQIAASVQAWPL